jgi:uncharacterized RDD family membrane protein YckC
MNDKSYFGADKDILGQDKPVVFIKEEELFELKQENPKKDYSKVYVLPSIKTRYISMFIDMIIILLISLGVSALFSKIGYVADYVRGLVFLVVIFLYEPILVSIGSTPGQILMNIRVIRFNDPEKKFPFPLALLRFIVKVFLGWLSFLTVTFNVNRRAIHDFLAGSIMISNKIEE